LIQLSGNGLKGTAVELVRNYENDWAYLALLKEVMETYTQMRKAEPYQPTSSSELNAVVIVGMAYNHQYHTKFFRRKVVTVARIELS